MRPLRHLLNFARFAGLATILLLLQANEPAARAVEGVSKGYPEEYQKVMTDVVRAFLDRDFKKALAELDQADQIIPDTPMALNTRGAIAIEERRYSEGQMYCEEALRKDNKFFPARFNLAEIPFQKKNYAAARKIFQQMLAEEKKHDSIELLRYRIFITYLMEKDDASAQAELDKMSPVGVTGAYHYAHAAWEFAHGNQSEGMSWIQGGDWVFSRLKNIYFADVMYDLGWLERPKKQAAEKPGALGSPEKPEPGSAPGPAGAPQGEVNK
jgi:tetratricopeptide (TPR) repeat protein